MVGRAASRSSSTGRHSSGARATHRDRRGHGWGRLRFRSVRIGGRPQSGPNEHSPRRCSRHTAVNGTRERRSSLYRVAARRCAGSVRQSHPPRSTKVTRPRDFFVCARDAGSPWCRQHVLVESRGIRALVMVIIVVRGANARCIWLHRSFRKHRSCRCSTQSEGGRNPWERHRVSPRVGSIWSSSIHIRPRWRSSGCSTCTASLRGRNQSVGSMCIRPPCGARERQNDRGHGSHRVSSTGHTCGG